MRVFDVQLLAVYRTIDLARPLLARSRGSIITIASMYAYFGGGTIAAYSAAKGGIVQLTKSLAEVYASDGIRVNSVAPGWIDTPLLAGGKRSGIPPAEFLPETQRYLEAAIGGWILGDEPFTARLAPDFPGYTDYDQLMRLDEWVGRE